MDIRSRTHLKKIVRDHVHPSAGAQLFTHDENPTHESDRNATSYGLHYLTVRDERRL